MSSGYKWSDILKSAHCVSGKRKSWVLVDPKGGKAKYRFEDSKSESDRELISKVCVDDGVFKKHEGKSADYLFVRVKKKDCYIVELKGSDLEYACSQILDTLAALKSAVDQFQISARIVLNKTRAPALRSSPLTRLKRLIEPKGTVYYRSVQMVETKNGIK